MKRNNVEYKQSVSEHSSLQEPAVEYQANHKHEFPSISEDELNNCCMPLAESKRLLLERIHKDFHK